MKKILIAMAIVSMMGASVAMGCSGCGCAAKAAKSTEATTNAIPADLICAKCGDVIGSEKCCKADAVKCATCGLNKGAPGCCPAPAEKK